MTEVAIGPSEALAALFTPAGKHDPYPLYDALWALGPVVPLGPKATMVLGYEECSAALREPALLVTDAEVHRETGMLEHSSWGCFTKIMMFSNEPDHERLRQFARGAYSARRVAELKPVATRLAGELATRLAGLAAAGPVDLVGEFAFTMTMTMTGDLLGIPEPDRMGLREAIVACTTAFDPILELCELDTGDAGMDLLVSYLSDLVGRRRAAPADDLTSIMVRDRDATGLVSEDELVASLVLFMIAGAQTPSDLIGNAALLAMTHPDAARAVAGDSRLVPAFVTETMRFDPAIHALTRVAATDLDFFGNRVAKGSRLLLILAAANRDARRFPEPNHFDLSRPDNQPLAFGLGPHYCLGAALARMQTEAAFPALLDHLPDLAPAGQPTYRDQLVQRGLARLDVTLATKCSTDSSPTSRRPTMRDG